jgi:hypothetical protein
MKRLLLSGLIAGVLVVLLTSAAHAEILAMLNYESKPENTVRKEGLAIIDVDPKSSGFGKILMDIPLPPDLVAHHLYYNRDMSKAYITALGKTVLHVLDLKRFPYRMKAGGDSGLPCSRRYGVLGGQPNLVSHLYGVEHRHHGKCEE